MRAVVAYKRRLDEESRSTLADALKAERAASLAKNSRVPHARIEARLAGLRRRPR